MVEVTVSQMWNPALVSIKDGASMWLNMALVLYLKILESPEFDGLDNVKYVDINISCPLSMGIMQPFMTKASCAVHWKSNLVAIADIYRISNIEFYRYLKLQYVELQYVEICSIAIAR